MGSSDQARDGWELQPIDDVEALKHLQVAGTASWRQFPAYASQAAAASGSEHQYLPVTLDAAPKALVNIRIKRLPVVGGGIALIAQGPVLLDHGNTAAPVLKAIADHVVGRKGLTLRINPPVDSALSLETMARNGFHPIAGSAYATFVLDIAQSEDQLRAGLDAKWRSDLRRGERGPVIITRSQDPQDFAALQPLLAELANRKGFTVPQNANFFAQVAGHVREPEHFAVHLAWNQGRLIGGHIGAFSGNMAVYLIGASNAEGRELRASFLLQWAAIRYAQERGLAAYDLGGIDETGNPDVFRFKQRMGGRRYNGPPVFERRPSGIRGTLVNLAETAYKRLRG